MDDAVKKCAICQRMLPVILPFVPYVIWKKKASRYDVLLHTLKPRSLTGDESMCYDFEGDGRRNAARGMLLVKNNGL